MSQSTASTCIFWIILLVQSNANANQCNPFDVLFGVSRAGSLGYSGFQNSKQYIQRIIDEGIPLNNSRIGITSYANIVDQKYASNLNITKPLQFWNYTDLSTTIAGLYWTGGWSNPGPMFASVIEQFSEVYEPDREQLLIIMGDGSSCADINGGGCSYSICQYKALLRASGIRIILFNPTDYNAQRFDCIDDMVFYTDYDPAFFFNPLCQNDTVNVIETGITPVSGVWNDDFIFNDNNYVNNTAGGINWYWALSWQYHKIDQGTACDTPFFVYYSGYTVKVFLSTSWIEQYLVLKMENYMVGGMSMCHMETLSN